jgi:hypothetical protein
MNEISDAMIHTLDTALLAYLGQQNAVEVRDLIFNMPTVRKAAWDMFAEAGSPWSAARGLISGVPPVASNAAKTGIGTSRSLNIISTWSPAARSIMRPARLRSIKPWMLDPNTQGRERHNRCSIAKRGWSPSSPRSGTASTIVWTILTVAPPIGAYAWK